MALLEGQSRVLEDDEALDAALVAAQARLDVDPHVIASSWAVYRLKPFAVEFWQGDAGRRHTRLQYTRQGERWTTRRLWP